MIQEVQVGYATGVVVNGAVHVLKRSSSSYALTMHGNHRRQYCCQDGCCDRGLQQDVRQVVEQAKALGATKVVIRTGQREFRVRQIAELPVEDVCNHVGHIYDGVFVGRR